MHTLAEDFRQRRRLLAQRFDRPVLIHSGRPARRNAPQNYPFRASSHFLYFAGWNQPRCSLLLSDGEVTLFYDPPSGDRAVWDGPGPEPDELKERFGFERILPRGQMPQAVCLELGAPESLLEAVVQLRLRHDAAARSQLEQAVDMTVRAHFQALRAIRPERREFQILATLLVSVTQEGGSPSYPAIVTRRGEVLHSTSYEGTLERGDLLLVDFGAENREGWAGDITRTFPVRTTFSPRQAEIYELVLKAQKAALKHCLPGREFRSVHEAVCLCLTHGLVELGLLRGDPAQLVERGAHALFFPHGSGHLLGLDVHDMEDLGDRAGYAPGRRRSTQFGLSNLRLDRILEPHMAITVEPGFYWNPQLLDNPERTGAFRDCLNPQVVEIYREVRGIRIEDDILITDGAPRILSAALPKELQEIEIVVNS